MVHTATCSHTQSHNYMTQIVTQLQVMITQLHGTHSATQTQSDTHTDTCGHTVRQLYTDTQSQRHTVTTHTQTHTHTVTQSHMDTQPHTDPYSHTLTLLFCSGSVTLSGNSCWNCQAYKASPAFMHSCTLNEIALPILP